MLSFNVLQKRLYFPLLEPEVSVLRKLLVTKWTCVRGESCGTALSASSLRLLRQLTVSDCLLTAYQTYYLVISVNTTKS